jgi:hypothetical protein
MDKIETTLPLPTVVVPPSPSVILDSGATATFVTRADAVHLHRSLPITNCPTVLSANGAVMRPTHSGVLPLSPLLSDKAQSAFVLDDLRTGTLSRSPNFAMTIASRYFPSTRSDYSKITTYYLQVTVYLTVYGVSHSTPRIRPTAFFALIALNPSWHGTIMLRSVVPCHPPSYVQSVAVTS